MTLTLDTSPIDIDAWGSDVSMVDEWLRVLWGVRLGASSPRSTVGPVHPACSASAGWLHALWGFSA